MYIYVIRVIFIDVCGNNQLTYSSFVSGYGYLFNCVHTALSRQLYMYIKATTECTAPCSL